MKVNEVLLDLKANYPNQFHIVLQTKHQQLLPILNQAIRALTDEQKAVLSQKWFHHHALNTGTTIPYTELYERTVTATTEGEMVKIVLNGEPKRLYLKKIETGEHYSEYFAVAIPGSGNLQRGKQTSCYVYWCDGASYEPNLASSLDLWCAYCSTDPSTQS